MALYRTISLTFWTDAKIVDDFTPEDRYFYLYLFTNPHTNLCGCYEVSVRQMSYETGYAQDKIKSLLKRFYEVHKVAAYSDNTKEVLLFNWHKYNWTASEKYRKPLGAMIENVKESSFREYLRKLFNNEDARYGIDTYCMETNCIDTECSDTSNTNTNTITNTVSNTNTDTISNSNTNTVNNTSNNKKHRYGEYKHVLLTDEEYKKLVQERGQAKTEAAITFLDEYLEMNGKSYKSCYLALRKWVFDAVDKQGNTKTVGNESAYQRDREWAEEMQAMQERGELNGF